MSKKSWFFLLVILLSLGCSTTTSLRSFIDPSIQSSSIKTIVVFPMRNTSFSPGEALDIDREITRGFQQKNPNIKIIGSAEAISLLNQKNLVLSYDSLLYGFEHSGIPNTIILKRIGSILGIDAILQGRLSDISQKDGHWGVGAEVGITSLTIRYTLLSTQTGSTLWEGIASANLKGKIASTNAPPLFETTLIARDKILTSIPKLGY